MSFGKCRQKIPPDSPSLRLRIPSKSHATSLGSDILSLLRAFWLVEKTYVNLVLSSNIKKRQNLDLGIKKPYFLLKPYKSQRPHCLWVYRHCKPTWENHENDLPAFSRSILHTFVYTFNPVLCSRVRSSHVKQLLIVGHGSATYSFALKWLQSLLWPWLRSWDDRNWPVL